MDYVHNIAQIGGFSSQSMPAVQIYYPEMNGGKMFNNGSVPDSCIPYDEEYYNDKTNSKVQNLAPVDLNDFYDGGDFKQNGNSGSGGRSPVDLNNFYDGGDFKQSNNRRDSHIINYGSQHYCASGSSVPCGSATAYRSMSSYCRQNREMNLRNGLYEPNGNNSNQNNLNGFPTYSDNYSYPNRRNSYW